ncbi:YbjQ family protein [Conchiformibius steedae]|uniref:YbjQ family protein n=1 Tax=Conchiformibius steedae TaxID=153493 RepID=A0A3P2A7H7_9NEIS|nr:heavy metal-binding domain-containing protein [Conchiformibius steedae]MDO5357252.1 heavy metal-binding domain-containing protein [Conchiformibius sp.]RRD91324.1 YbjQ family protein [Conchiformibius steedae]
MSEETWWVMGITLFPYLLPVGLLVLGFVFGSRAEKKHYASILAREEQLRHIVVLSVKRPPKSFAEQQMVMGSVVVSSDYFTRLLAWFRNIFGGNVRSYETLLDRARREAILRMKAQADEIGAEMVLNMKFETATLGSPNQPQQQGALGTVEVLAYGTAGKIRRAPATR